MLLCLYLTNVDCALVRTLQCENVDKSGFQLEPFVIDVALDEDSKLLKFFINSAVYDDKKELKKVITDVNPITNRYTTFNVDIQFMGRSFINEDLRFCDMVAVKYTAEYLGGPRFDDNSDSKKDINEVKNLESSTGRSRMSGTFENNNLQVNKRSQTSSGVHMSHSNSTIEQLFDNSTGSLTQCPLYSYDSIMLYYDVDISDHYLRLGSYGVRFSVISNDEASTLISCNRAYVTPVQLDDLSRILLIGITVLLLVTLVINIFTVICSSYQESSNPFLFIASTICNEKLLKQLDATVQAIILYLQFALFIGGLDLLYPGFYQPLIANIRWCALMGINIINGDDSTQTKEDNIYTTLDSGGLRNLAVFSTSLEFHDSWANFILALLAWIVVLVIALQFIMILKTILIWIYKRLLTNGAKRSAISNINSKFTWKNNVYFIFGQVLNNFFAIFALPFLVLTVYLFATASNLNDKKFYPNISELRSDIFNKSISYNDLFSPVSLLIIDNDSNTLDSDSQATNIDDFQSPNINITNFAKNLTVVKTQSHYESVPKSNIILGSILFAIWIGLAFFFAFNYIVTIVNFRIIMNTKVSRLYTSMKTILLWAFCYHQYHPDKVYFVIVDFLLLIIKLLIIGLLQSHGVVQVACLIVIEFFNLTFLFIIRPHFRKITWTSSRSVLPIARFLVTILCIPYIRGLDLSEETRTYVAYAQLLIHAFIAIVFIIHLFYCFVITIISIKRKREKSQHSKPLLSYNALGSIDEFDTQFEYHPVSNPPPLLLNNTQEVDRVLLQEDYQVNEEENDNDEDLYYRAKSEKQLQKVYHERYNGQILSMLPELHNKDFPLMEESRFSSQTDFSFQNQQHDSNIRKQQNDYTFREGDLIYRKYFVDDSIDPEVKALWDSRNNWNFNKDQPQEQKREIRGNSEHVTSFSYSKKSETEKGLLQSIKGIFGFKSYDDSAVEKGFQVSRPRPLIVRPVNSQKFQQKQKSINDSQLATTSSSTSINSSKTGRPSNDG